MKDRLLDLNPIAERDYIGQNAACQGPPVRESQSETEVSEQRVGREALASLPAAEAEGRLKAIFKEGLTDVESASWRFDGERSALVIRVSGTGDLEWEKEDAVRAGRPP